MSKSKGYIKLYRDVLTHWVYDDEILFRAWINLLLTANHTDNKVMFGGDLITIHSGETLTSLRKLSESWKCGLKKTRSIIDILEKEQMIIRKSVKKGTQKGTLLTIVNYGVYQVSGHTKENGEEYGEEHGEGTQTIMNKECLTNDKESEGHAPTLIDIQNYCFKKNITMSDIAQQRFYTWLLSDIGQHYLSCWGKRLELWVAEDKDREAKQPKQIKKNQALEFAQREYTEEQINALERKKLGLA